MRWHYLHVLALLIAASPAMAQQSGVSLKSTEVAPNIYMLEGVGGFAGGNLGILMGEDGAVLIDDGMQPYFEKISAAIRKQIGSDVDFVVNTHAHGDHVGGNKGMSEAGATIIAHDKLRQRLVDKGITGAQGQMPATKHWLPEVTFSDTVTLHLNGQHVHIFHVASAHTDGDAIVHFPDANVIHSGDIVFNGLFPFIDLDSGGSVAGYLAAQKRVLSLAGADTKIIPGHGPLANKDDVQAAYDMLADACARIEALIRDGKTDDEIMALNPLADYDEDWTWGFITTEKMTRTLIRDIQGN
ncbi:MAG: MBL fold metallo-hydrolase [Gammaproteobacteria bacterium]|nr:MBL fold metallo-hydrolase [Gammaproteobacteria bacterium]